MPNGEAPGEGAQRGASQAKVGASETTIVFVGHARLPQSLAARDLPAVVSVELEVDASSHRIIAVAARDLPPLGQKVLEQALLGRDLREGPEGPVEEVRRRYVSASQRAICTAIVNAYDAYRRHREQSSSF